LEFLRVLRARDGSATDEHTFAVVPVVRCDGCDNGIERGWAYCAFCGRKIDPEALHELAADK
jgi:hypothetical protein